MNYLILIDLFMVFIAFYFYLVFAGIVTSKNKEQEKRFQDFRNSYPWMRYAILFLLAVGVLNVLGRIYGF